MKERSANRQLAINMIASLSTFAVGLGVRFFLTPYIVRTLGREAYGFIGLSADILSYTGLITIALNSMAVVEVLSLYARTIGLFCGRWTLMTLA